MKLPPKITIKDQVRVLIALFFIGVVLLFSAQNNKPSSLGELARQIIDKCSESQYKSTCYDTEIPKLMDFLTLKDAFNVASVIQDSDSSYKFCHVLGHKLSARQVQKNPSKWKETVALCPSGICSNGCIHGVFQERFRTESLSDEQIEEIKPDLKTICEKNDKWNPTGLEQGSCYHALGHLSMYLTGADTVKSLSLCREISVGIKKNFSRICFDGVFMQIFQPLEPEDFALVKGKQPEKGDLLAFCSTFSSKQKSSCISESWPLFIADIQSPDGLLRFCALEEENERNRCYDALEYVLAVQFNLDIIKIEDFCKSLPIGMIGRCFANSSTRLIETDYRNIEKAVSFCKTSEKYDPSKKCIKQLLDYSSYNFHPGSEEFSKFCELLDPNFAKECLSKAKKADSI